MEFAATGVPANFAMFLIKAAESVIVSSCSLLEIFLKYCSSVKVASRLRDPEPGRLKSTKTTWSVCTGIDSTKVRGEAARGSSSCSRGFLLVAEAVDGAFASWSSTQ